MCPNEIPEKYGPRWFATEVSRSELPAEQFCSEEQQSAGSGAVSDPRQAGTFEGESTYFVLLTGAVLHRGVTR